MNQPFSSKAKMLRFSALALVAISCAEGAPAQEPVVEPAAILEVGAAGEWPLRSSGSSYGPSLAVEATPIGDWLEIEGGLASLFSRGQTEWDVDLLFKKPFTLSPTAEFMIGAGPSWSHAVAHGRNGDTLGVEAALDFMFWPWNGRRLGWYIEPSYGYSFSADHEQTLSVSLGFLIPIP